MNDNDPQPMLETYARYYKATRSSPTYSKFCKRVFGLDGAQHGFSDLFQINSLLAILNLNPGDRALDLGCGSGSITAYIADHTGAHVTGIDIIPEAIRQANIQWREKEKYLSFKVMDIGKLDFPVDSFDVLISIDSLYFTDIIPTITKMKRILKNGGHMGLVYSHGISPDAPLETFDLLSLHPDRTPLAITLQNNGMRYKTWDYTAEDYTHALLKKKVSEDLRSEFKAEGSLFLYRNRHDEAVGVMKAIELDAHKRYLYLVTK